MTNEEMNKQLIAAMNAILETVGAAMLDPEYRARLATIVRGAQITKIDDKK